MGMATAVAAAEGQLHVLAVDDSLIDRKLIERLLKISSFQVTTVDSGSKALEFLGCPSPDDPHTHLQQLQVQVNLIITDYCMPHMNGYDLLKKLKESSSLRNIPVVVMSSENVPSRITRCLEEGAEEFLLKPVTLADVNRLKPHMLRAKCGQQQNTLKVCQIHEAKPTQQQQQQQQQQQASQQKTEDQQQEQQQNHSKRKSIEDGLSPPNRTRPRSSGLTTLI